MREWRAYPDGLWLLDGGPADPFHWRARDERGYWEYWALGYWERVEPGSDPKGYCQARVWWEDRETT